MRELYARFALWLFEVLTEPAIKLREKREEAVFDEMRRRRMARDLAEVRAARGEPPADAP